MSLSIQGLCKSFAGRAVLEDIDLQVDAGEFVCLLGPSGCGKTTLLRAIAGLLAPDEGRIVFAGRDLAGLPARQRGFGIVFQSYSLFPHMTVAQNVGYGLRIRATDAVQVRERVAGLLAMVGLSDYAGQYPGQLSGGQQQRVAIARALAVDPALLLLDEPLSALDARVRAGLRVELRELQRRLGIPTIMVTHDQDEAMSMADRVVCMNAGRIEQMGTPAELYCRPLTRFVAEFMGRSNLLPPPVVRELLPQMTVPAGRDVVLCVRPEHLDVQSDPAGGAKVVSVSFLGSVQHIELDWQGRRLLAEMPGYQLLRNGQQVSVGLRNVASCVWVAPGTPGQRPAGGASA